ncbi:hypothetical protein ACFPMF_01730 [Larkinella bovis]|uniref:Uncharacterized protein n=1 Tax=Larkinella bovis TaxID=683041 RepID=A0ABW0I3C1_9BACT
MAQFAMDTRLYSWSQTEIRIGGLLAIGIIGAQWDAKQEKEFIYGKGNEPLAIKSGNKSYEGTLTLLQNDLERIFDANPLAEGDINRISPFEVQITFRNEYDQMVNYTLFGCQFNSSPMNAQQNMKRMEIALPIMYLGQKRVAI